MKRKVFALLLCMCLFASFSVNAFAEADASIVAAYRAGDTVYSFLNPGDGDQMKRIGFEKIGGISDVPERLMGSGTGVTYVLLLDSSQSMERHKEELIQYASSLYSNEWESRLLVIPFVGELFEQRYDSAEDELGIDGLTDFIDNLESVDSGSSPCACTRAAIDLLTQDYPAKPGDLVNLILVTDDIDNSDANRYSLDSTRAKLAASPEILFHTLVFSEYSNAERLGTRGLNSVVSESGDIDGAARDLKKYIAYLYTVRLPSNVQDEQTGRSSLKLYISYDNGENGMLVNEVALDEVPSLVAGEDGGYRCADAPASEADKEPMPEDDASVPENDSDNSAQDAEPSEESRDDEGQDMAPPEGGEGAAARDAESGGKLDLLAELEELYLKDKTIFIACSALLLAVVVLALVFASSARKRRKANNGCGSSIFMKLEVIAGRYRSNKLEFYLTDQLLIGRDRKCDIVFRDNEVSGCNSRVFIKNGFVYIEDLGSGNGTALEGMQIFAPNRLRSGDIISIGGVRFCFKF